ncbi:MAG: ABC transporter permease subunit [Treponema sp.]|nr:ABC transporter permease subunit [Treponema sp.]
MKHKKYIGWTIAGIIFLFLLWELAARLYNSSLILPGPIPVFLRFIALITTPRFLISLRESFFRVLLGITIAVPAGIIAGIATGLDKRVNAFFSPLFSVISATPVISVILIAFLVLGSGNTPVFSAFLMIFPVMATNVAFGIKSTDSRLKELFFIFKMNRKETLRFLYLPSLLPFILGGLSASLSLCWKVVVAAEVIVQPMNSLGLGMSRARTNLETPELFAWTAATVIAAASTQGILSLILKTAGKKK